MGDHTHSLNYYLVYCPLVMVMGVVGGMRMRFHLMEKREERGRGIRIKCVDWERDVEDF